MLHILYFAQLRDSVNCSEESIEWYTDLNSIAAVKQQLSQRDELWQKAFNKHILAAVNQEMVTDEHLVKDGDEIAFFPPVTGG